MDKEELLRLLNNNTTEKDLGTNVSNFLIETIKMVRDNNLTLNKEQYNVLGRLLVSDNIPIETVVEALYRLPELGRVSSDKLSWRLANEPTVGDIINSRDVALKELVKVRNRNQLVPYLAHGSSVVREEAQERYEFLKKMEEEGWDVIYQELNPTAIEVHKLDTQLQYYKDCVETFKDKTITMEAILQNLQSFIEVITPRLDKLGEFLEGKKKKEDAK